MLITILLYGITETALYGGEHKLFPDPETFDYFELSNCMLLIASVHDLYTKLTRFSHCLFCCQTR